MNKLVALRLYFHHAEKVQHERFWHHFTRPSLASHLMKSAHSKGIEQVLMHQVHGGYLAGGKPQLHHVEHPHPHLPHCIELIDIESKLRAFLDDHAHQFKNVRALFLPCEPVAEPVN
ncbi:DUF190 domain-containing protein [Dyella mobilis]|uniref:DUF190 domain-containing protein n=1 Tax=Dyella mobilis TaxID=1849582 RepID=A0ABS2KEE9_9GAMM|nr:DUF190 domain-containing protein [Dyella mobilis]MBM7128723.1 DUF190 domain-containing protein [Dyella mobilis]